MKLSIGLFLCTFLQLCTHSIHAETLHSIIVANTNDFKLKASCQKDIDRWTAELKQVCEHTNLTFNSKVLQGKDFRYDKVLQTIQSLKIERNDVIVFLYSGHGKGTTKNPFPKLQFADQAISLMDLNTKIKKLECRLKIVIAEACNVPPPPFTPSSPLLTRTLRSGNHTEGYKKLFLNYKGNLLFSSGTKGSYSYQTKYTGGIFLYNFVNAIREVAQNPIKAVDWIAIYRQTIIKTFEMSLSLEVAQPEGNYGQTPSWIYDLTYKPYIPYVTPKDKTTH